MLTLELPMEDLWDQSNELFIVKGDYGVFNFEHNLLAVSEWESKWRIPFLDDSDKTIESMKDYARIMCTESLPVEFIDDLAMMEIAKYINEDLSATRIRKDDSSSNKKIITSEVLYAYMSEAGIPFECEEWHLSRLIKLIDVVGNLRNPPKKMSQQEIMEQNRKLNEERRRKFKTKG